MTGLLRFRKPNGPSDIVDSLAIRRSIAYGGSANTVRAGANRSATRPAAFYLLMLSLTL
jgi:hypothetical protein